MKRMQQGFTLIELMIVVAIIGILAAVAIPAYQDYTVRSKVSEGLALASSAKVGVAEAFYSGGTAGVTAFATAYNGDFTATKYVDDITVTDATGVITVTYSANTGPADGTTIVLTPFVDGSALADTASGNVDWACASATNTTATARGYATAGTGSLEARYAPSECK
ncbi:MAG: pilin [Alcanivoracaceae bacterium]|jgi:type IV pilus assembly protein PilA|nr:pilin [Alcanivoracaceae bacterium]